MPEQPPLREDEKQPPKQDPAPEKPAGQRAPTAEEHPRTTWICENSRCRYFGVRRTVRWQHLGAGLYLVGTVRCHCGGLPVRETRQPS